MKILILILTIFTGINLSNNNYVTKKEEFVNIISDAYEEYYLDNLETVAGDLVLVIGKINNNFSFSLYFNQSVSKTYNIDIYDQNKDILYKLQEYEDYQIYYNISLNDDSNYIIKLNSINNSTFMEYNIMSYYNDFDNLNIIKGNNKGVSSFPYNTKLKNKTSCTNSFSIFGLIFIIIEVVFLLVIFRRRNKNNRNRQESYEQNRNYQTLNYTILDSEKVDDNEN